jgi:hypothetical protein
MSNGKRLGGLAALALAGFAMARSMSKDAQREGALRAGADPRFAGLGALGEVSAIDLRILQSFSWAPGSWRYTPRPADAASKFNDNAGVARHLRIGGGAAASRLSSLRAQGLVNSVKGRSKNNWYLTAAGAQAAGVEPLAGALGTSVAAGDLVANVHEAAWSSVQPGSTGQWWAKELRRRIATAQAAGQGAAARRAAEAGRADGIAAARASGQPVRKKLSFSGIFD